ncbi:unnamed protein product [Trichobilharzia szidati]|nr:unnamed protein product [Trichobilharzia szidati]
MKVVESFNSKPPNSVVSSISPDPMDMFKGYLKSVTSLVNNLAEIPCSDTTEVSFKNIENQNVPNEDSDGINSSKSMCETQNSEHSPSSENFGGYFNWIPNLLTSSSESSVLYYMNSLASLGVNSTDEKQKQIPQKPEEKSSSVVITEDISEIEVSKTDGDNADDDPSRLEEFEEEDKLSASKNDLNTDWMGGISAKTTRVWEQIKQDFSEVVHSVSEPKDVVYRTASSFRDHITAAANTVKNIDPNEFLLPDIEEKTVKQQQPTGNETDESDLTALPPELPSLPKIKQDMSQLIDSFCNGLMSTGTFLGLIGTEENQSKEKCKHKARLDVLRADPATYEVEPPLPPASSNIHSYADWRTAYFDEDNCQPMQGIPLADARNPEYSHLPVEELTQPPHPSPSELLDTYPFMRTYLTQLVHPDGKITDDKSISDADFWSRYYYRVWLLDSTEFRRRRLNERVESVSTMKQPVGIDADEANWSMHTDEALKNADVTEGDEWPDTLDSDEHTAVENDESVIKTNDEKLITEISGGGGEGDDDTAATASAATTLISTKHPSVSSGGGDADGFGGGGNTSDEDNNSKARISIGGGGGVSEKKRRKKRSCKKSTNEPTTTTTTTDMPLLMTDTHNTERRLSTGKIETKEARLDTLTTSSTENQNSTNVLSDFEEMTSGSSSVVILTDEVDQEEVDNTVITGGCRVEPKTMTTNTPSDILLSEEKSSDSDGGWGDDDDDSEDEADSIDHSTDDKNKVTSAAKPPTKETNS